MKSELTTLSYSHPDVEEKLSEFEKDFMIFQLYGKQDAGQNRPITREYWLARVYNPVQAASEKMNNYLQQTVQPVAAAIRRTEVLAQAQEEVDVIQAEVNYTEEHLFKAEQKIKELLPQVSRRLIRIIVIVFLILAGIADCYCVFDGIRRSGMPLIAAIIYAVVAGLAVGLGAAIAAKKYVAAEGVAAKRRILISTITVAFLFFLVLGIYRAHIYNSRPDISIQSSTAIHIMTSASVSGVMLAAFSFLLFVAGFFFSVATAKTAKEEAAERILDQLKKELNRLQNEIEENRTAITEIQKAAQTEYAICTAKCEYCIAVQKRIANIGKAALAMYASTNISQRRDGQVPPFLAQVPAITFAI